jgi:hypothetical protein
MATNDKWTIEIARHKTESAGGFWSASLLNTVCAVIPAVGVFLYFTAPFLAVHRIDYMIPSPFRGLANFFLLSILLITIGGLPVAGAVFFLSESKKAQDAATSFVAGFFVAIVSLLMLSRFYF